MTLHVVDISKYQATRINPLNVLTAREAGFNIINIALDLGRGDDVLPLWAPEYANKARALSMGICTYRWLDSRLSGVESARRAYDRMKALGGPAGMAHAVDCEDDATEQIIREYLIEMTRLLGRPIALYSADWWWTRQGRNWPMASLTPYLWAAPNDSYLPEYPGDGSEHWRAGYGGWHELSIMQYSVKPLPGTPPADDCSMSAIRDHRVWDVLTGGGVVSSRPNPNPTRISNPLWYLVCACTDDTPTSFVDEYGGTFLRKPGSHADTAWLKVNYPNDYSLKGAKQNITTGPLSAFTRAFDWTFPSAQRGDWSQIGVYSLRVKEAWESNDPRMYGVFEILCQTPEDKQPEGYVFYPERRFRVPDSTHEWHLHIGILTQFINDQAAMEALWSVLSGQSLATWRSRISGGKDEDMVAIWYDGKGYARGNGVMSTSIDTWAEMLEIQRLIKAGVFSGTGTILNTTPELSRAYGPMFAPSVEVSPPNWEQIEAAIKELSQRLADADNDLPMDPASIIEALTAVVREDADTLNANMEKLSIALAENDNDLPADEDVIVQALKRALREGAGDEPVTVN